MGTTNSCDSVVEGKSEAIDEWSPGELIKVLGSIYDRSAHVLVDTGSSHNIIWPQLSSELQLPLQKSAVGDDVKPVRSGGMRRLVRSEGICESVPMTIQGYQFSADLHLLPIHRDGIDVVLGMEWIRRLGEVEFHMEKMTMNLVLGPGSKVRLFSFA